MIFVDTGAWFALFVPTDRDHLAAESWFERNTEPLITTDYIIDELLTLLRMRRHAQRAGLAGERLFEEEIFRIAWVSPVDIHQGWDYFRQYADNSVRKK